MAYYEDKLSEYHQMFEEASAHCADGYKGYDGANALSMYVYNKYGVNAASNNIAHDALCEIMGTEKYHGDKLHENSLCGSG